MRWGSFSTEFVRPVHWAVLLYGNAVIDCEILGLKTGSTTHLATASMPRKPSLIRHNPESYADALYQQGKVIADIEQRKAIIKDKARASRCRRERRRRYIEDDLLEEIAALNEWPVPVTGGFDPRFLELPAKC